MISSRIFIIYKPCPFFYWDFFCFSYSVNHIVIKRYKFKNPELLDRIYDKEQNINNLKILLANHATQILHGEKAAKKAADTARSTFERKGIGSDLPEIKLKISEINEGINILDFLAKNKIMSSKSEAKRAIVNRGLRIDNIIIEDENKILKKSDFKSNILKLSHGKKRHFLVKII